MAMQAMLPNPNPPRRTISRVAVTAQLERLREEAAQAVADAMAIQQRLLAALDASGVLWREITGEDAPDLEITARVVRSA